MQAMKLVFPIVLAALSMRGTSSIAQGHGAPIPLANLVTEAKNNNTRIGAATHASQAAAYKAQQVSTLPDPEFTLRSFSVGSPKPLAGFSNSELAYVGFGASQELPFPGKLRLRGEAAERAALAQHAQIGIYTSNIADQIKTLYFRIAYLYQMYDLDDRGTSDLAALIQNEISKYTLGIGSQAEVLQAQLERTKLLRETTQHHEEVGALQATLKALLHRSPDSPDIVPEPIAPSTLRYSDSELEQAAEKQNPTLIADDKSVNAETAQLESAKRDIKPDFNVGYMFRQTGSDYRDEYLLTFSVQLPRRKRVDAEIAEAGEKLTSARLAMKEDQLRQLAEIQKQYVIVKSSEDLMKECKEGLIPQSKAVYQSKLAAYQADREKFSAVIQAFLEQISFEDEYLQALVEHETAMAHLETLTEEKLR